MASVVTFMVISIRLTSGCSMIATRGAAASRRLAGSEPWRRSLAYSVA
jgi:uncharacterized protein YceK